MNGAFEVGAVAMRAQQSALEVHANNVANISTPGFKRAEVQFAEVVSTLPDPVTENERLARQGSTQNGGVRMATRTMISEAGELESTGSAMDVAVDGAGFFELMGQNGESVLWRGGRLAIDRDGYLGAEGLSAFRSMIAVPTDALSLAIDLDGTVSATVADGETLDLGQIALVRPETDAGLLAMGAGQFRLTENARLTDSVAGEDGAGIIRQGMIESSNVDMTQAMVEMLVLQRAYSASAQVIQAADQVASITNNLQR